MATPCRGKWRRHVTALRGIKPLRGHAPHKISCSLRCTQFYVEVPVGIAPTHEGFAVPCLTTWLRHQMNERATQHREEAGWRKGLRALFHFLLEALGSMKDADSIIARTSFSSVVETDSGVSAVNV